MKLLEGKVVYITGGTRGIGKGIVKSFAAQGATVIFTASKESEAALEFVKSLETEGHTVRFMAYDVAKFAETENAIKKAIAEFGHIDVLVNNAGITRDNLLMRMSENDWDNVMSVNLKSVFNHVKAVQPFMLKQRAGSIINLSSVVGIDGNAGQTNYAASKAGIIGFSKSIAKEIGSRNIRCNVIAPGFIATDMTENLPENMKNEWIQKI
ncbi:MAG: SDR family NAD(P)-dependent oxidoreductase, partial [Bacteroidales bacterium]|nr:SDR family NAD(P)-dependent oxidoreductase [Bacteroidales bacterium]